MELKVYETEANSGFESRRDMVFQSVAGLPLKVHPIQPPYEPGRPRLPRGYSYSIINFAMKVFYLNEEEYFSVANEKLKENCYLYIEDKVIRDDRDSFYWSIDILCRIIEFYGDEGTVTPGRLYHETQQLIFDMMYLWAKNNSQLIHAEYKNTKTWHIWESENHHIQRFSAAWHISRLLMKSSDYFNRVYDDGGTPEEHYIAWTNYAKEYMRERARKSLFIETGNSFYGLHALKGIYNIYDFTESNELKRLSGNLLDLYWSVWAQEQINGVRGGGKSRVYPGVWSLKGQDPFRTLVWYYLGIGKMTEPKENEFSVLTSDYRLPEVVADIALDTEGRGNYEIIQRPLGLAEDGHYLPNPEYVAVKEWGGIVRYGYCTPTFVLGTLMVEARPYEDWTLISSQNRWQGVIFRGHEDCRIVPQCRTSDSKNEKILVKRAYYQHWSAQSKGTLVTQKLITNDGVDEMRVWIAGAGLTNPVIRGKWCFTEAESAYAAVCIVNGGWHWEDEKGILGSWMVCEDEWTPVILEVCEKVEFSGFQSFQEAVLANELSYSNNKLIYRSIYGDCFEFYTDYSKLPLINGTSAMNIPNKAFDSPFVQSDWDSGIVEIKKGERKLVLNFNE